VALSGPDRYASVEAGLAPEVSLGIVTLRGAIAAGWASRDSPLDELHGLGGPTSLAGLRHEEWLGREKLGGELRLLRDLAGWLEAHVYAHAGRVGDAVSRADLSRRARFGAGAGVKANLPFGPLSFDWGITEGGEHRADLSFGPEF
jgi:outer membrane protein assembly factor BamA